MLCRHKLYLFLPCVMLVWARSLRTSRGGRLRSLGRDKVKRRPAIVWIQVAGREEDLQTLPDSVDASA